MQNYDLLFLIARVCQGIFTAPVIYIVIYSLTAPKKQKLGRYTISHNATAIYPKLTTTEEMYAKDLLDHLMDLPRHLDLNQAGSWAN